MAIVMERTSHRVPSRAAMETITRKKAHGITGFESNSGQKMPKVTFQEFSSFIESKYEFLVLLKLLATVLKSKS